jgi:biopolymer transport protein ExbB
MSPSLVLLDRGGVVIWVIAALSVVSLTVIIWKVWQFWRLGVWGGAAAERAVEDFRSGKLTQPGAGGGIRLRVVRVSIASINNLAMTDGQSREETERVARSNLSEARPGLRFLEVVVSVAPLLGLLGTVLGMISAFQALQASGARADPAVLAGGIWEALLTTAAGMGVAIPVALALAWFDAVIERVAADLEDLLTRVFLAARAAKDTVEQHE